MDFTNRRTFLQSLTGLYAWAAVNPLMITPTKSLPSAVGNKQLFGKIAVEEAFATPNLLDEWRKLLADGAEEEPGFRKLYGSFLNSPATRNILNQLTDLGEGRIQDMDRHGINMQILSITAPGVQIFPMEKAVDLARNNNDYLAEFVNEHPTRYAGLAAVAPQAPKQAAYELERAVSKLGMKGAIVNSHTQGEYLDNPKYWELFEAAQALDVPIYLHPRTPSSKMLAPFLSYGLEGAGWGFAMETSLHAMRLILSGLFDYFPNLKIVLGHLGEGIPFWLSRIDNHFGKGRWTEKMKSSHQTKQLQKLPSEYFKDNFFITTSGMNWSPALTMALSVLGAERILFAIDYPYESTAKAVEGIEKASIDDSTRMKVYQLNAEKLFNLKLNLNY